MKKNNIIKIVGFFLIGISGIGLIITNNFINVTTKSITSITTVSKARIYVDVKGEVKNPGVYMLDEGSIVMDAILMAGGFTGNHETSNINLSRTIKNAEVITISKKGENIDNQYNESNGLININTASKEVLDTLPGIGPSIAQKIIDYRVENYFYQIEDIMNVSGIKESIFEKIKDFITV